MTAAEATPNPLIPAVYDVAWAVALAVGLALLAVALVHLARRKDTTPTETALWALVVLAAPLVGPAVYLLIGRRRQDAQP
ncbi:PLD nuclease N-terminal domain-containing protein [Georgenia sp. AZ-5]|uniref:PLD nuclease N-terminal domain-containing protein n=1 Tax=Georgenia sp. AZ-5 TaxID=3367526 RepID=UPI003754E2AB